MKTVYTTLPIYKAQRDISFHKAKRNGSPVTDAYIHTPRHRLPSFQWYDNGDGAATVSSISLLTMEGIETDITSYFVTLPILYTTLSVKNYFISNGQTLNYALPVGLFQLKITMDTNHIYYSDFFLVDCVYCPFAETFVNNSFDTFTISDTTISSAIDAGAGAYADSDTEQSVYLGQVLTIMFYLTTTGATTPSFSLVSDSLGIISDVVTSAAGLNELTITTTRAADDVKLRIQTAGTSNFSATTILVYTQYGCNHVTLSFSSCCNLGDIIYENDFAQTLWIPSDSIEPAFPYVEKGQENGLGKFIPTFRRQEKTYIIRWATLPQYMVDVLNRLKMHDVITYIDQLGEAFVVETVDTEVEWIGDDKYYASVSLTIDLGESIVIGGCC